MAYISTGKPVIPDLPYLPLGMKTKAGEQLTVDWLRAGAAGEEDVARWLNDEITVGNSYPYTDQLTLEQFRSFYLAHAAFIVRTVDGTPVGAFYVKPNFPGPCSHICNMGFLVAPSMRGKGIGKASGIISSYVGRDLGFVQSHFNLVFLDNPASLALWDSLGHKRVGLVPRARKLPDGSYVDAIQFSRQFDDLGPTPQ